MVEQFFQQEQFFREQVQFVKIQLLQQLKVV